tara:strand:+ start:478 stop:612 length:135 start_codon:yes stop_codon:yes gene_type:complete
VVKVFPEVQLQQVVIIVQQQVVAELRQQVMVLEDHVLVVRVELE